MPKGKNSHKQVPYLICVAKSYYHGATRFASKTVRQVSTPFDGALRAGPVPRRGKRKTAEIKNGTAGAMPRKTQGLRMSPNILATQRDSYVPAQKGVSRLEHTFLPNDKNAAPMLGNKKWLCVLQSEKNRYRGDVWHDYHTMNRQKTQQKPFDRFRRRSTAPSAWGLSPGGGKEKQRK